MRGGADMQKLAEVVAEMKIPQRASSPPLPEPEREAALDRVAERLAEALLCRGFSRQQLGHCFETFDRSREPVAYQKALACVENQQTLVLWGPCGTGKTHLACAILRRHIEDCGQVTGIYTDRDATGIARFLPFGDLLRRVRATYGDDSESEQGILSRYWKVPILALDDVGNEAAKDPSFSQRIGYAMIDYRYRQELPVILTTNCHPDKLAWHIGQAAVDRLFERGEFVEMRSKSYRRKK